MSENLAELANLRDSQSCEECRYFTGRSHNCSVIGVMVSLMNTCDAWAEKTGEEVFDHHIEDRRQWLKERAE